MEPAKKLAGQDIADLENKLQPENDVLFRAYTLDVVQHHLSDTDELERRKRFMAKRLNGSEVAWFCFAALCPLTDDRKGWDIAMKFFDDHPHPHLGFFSYKLLYQQNAEAVRMAEWRDILELSASQGHLQARRWNFELKIQSLGIARGPLNLMHRIWIGFAGVAISLRNPRDDRLPRKSIMVAGAE